MNIGFFEFTVNRHVIYHDRQHVGILFYHDTYGPDLENPVEEQDLCCKTNKGLTKGLQRAYEKSPFSNLII